MISRVFDLVGLLTVAIVAAVAYLLPAIVGSIKRVSGVLSGIEAAVLAVVGGVLARLFISILLSGASDSPSACLAVGWGFFLVPGFVDTFAGQTLTTPELLLMFAGIVGAFIGMMGGIYHIYDWRGLGWLGFPLDVTWALAGNTIGSLLHVVNLGWGKHSTETRDNAHRYQSGFGLRYHPRFAFTQGCVMSNLDKGLGQDLYRHEKTHVWQSRAFGPLYTLTYLAWMAIWVLPAVIAGVIVKGPKGVFAGPNNWCYFNNPWETWAYAVQGVARTSIEGVDAGDQKMIWPAKYVIAWAVPFFVVATLLALLTVFSAWSAAPAKRGQRAGTSAFFTRKFGALSSVATPHLPALSAPANQSDGSCIA
jgi:chromate transport protein ChrA